MSYPLIRILTGTALEESVPYQLTQNWQHWVLENEGLEAVPVVPGSSDWLNPRSLDVLWIPLGQSPLSCRVALQVLLQDGRPRYLMPSIDLNLALRSGNWRNRGLKTLPLARTWQKLVGLELHRLRLSVFRKPLDGAWQNLCKDLSLVPSLNRLAGMLAEGPEELASGFNFVTLPLADLVESPRPEERWRVLLNAWSDPKAEGKAGGDPVGGLLDILVEEVSGFGDSLSVPVAYQALVDHFADRP